MAFSLTLWRTMRCSTMSEGWIRRSTRALVGARSPSMTEDFPTPFPHVLGVLRLAGPTTRATAFDFR
jgi:hypothetical protein